MSKRLPCSYSMPPEIHRRAATEAERLGVSTSRLVEELLTEALDRRTRRDATLQAATSAGLGTAALTLLLVLAVLV